MTEKVLEKAGSTVTRHRPLRMSALDAVAAAVDVERAPFREAISEERPRWSFTSQALAGAYNAAIRQ
jgi:hypothetical protein